MIRNVVFKCLSLIVVFATAVLVLGASARNPSAGQSFLRLSGADGSAGANSTAGTLPQVLPLGSGSAADRPKSETATKQSVDVSGSVSQLFLPAVSYGSGGFLAWSTVVADLNGDGKLDLVVVNYSGESNGDGSVAVLLGNGDGTFQSAVVYDSGGGGPTSVAVGDLNHDGKPDLVVAGQGCPSTIGDCLGVLLGNGDGTFRSVVTYATGGRGVFGSLAISTPILIADMNSDAKPDLVVANQTGENYGDGMIGILLGKGDGSFEPVATYDSGGFAALSIAVADLNGDGTPDLAVVNCGPTGSSNCPNQGQQLAVLLGIGDGTFRPAQIYATNGTGNGAYPVVADLNGDGKPDLIVGNGCTLRKNDSCANQGSVGAFLGNGDGTFRSVVNYASGGGTAGAFTVVDVDGDGKLDIAMVNGGAGVLRGNGDGTFQLADAYPSSGATYSMKVTDFNSDGKLDLVGSNLTSSTIDVSLGNGSGFGLPMTFPSGGFYILGLAVADVNGDGRPDLIATNLCLNENTCTVGEDETGAVAVLLNNSGFVYRGTTTKLTFPGPSAVGRAITYTATVTNPNGNTLTGSVVFYDHTKQIGQATLDNNQATVTVQYQKTGSHAIQAAYSGDGDHTGSTSETRAEYIKTLPVVSAMALTTSGSPSMVGQAVTFTAAVTSKLGTIPDGELVTFSDGNTLLGSVALSDGAASYTTSSLSAKTHTINAAYAGDSTFKPSHRSVKQVVQR